jgi:hypothetical protein
MATLSSLKPYIYILYFIACIVIGASADGLMDDGFKLWGHILRGFRGSFTSGRGYSQAAFLGGVHCGLHLLEGGGLRYYVQLSKGLPHYLRRNHGAVGYVL